MNQNNFQFRPAQPTDLSEIIEIYQQTTPLQHPLAIIIQTIQFNIASMKLSNPVFFYVACCKNDILAIAIARHRASEAVYEVECLCKRKFRHQGLGQALMKHLLSECKNRGISYFLASVHPDNLNCINMLNKLKFESDDCTTDSPLCRFILRL